MALNNVTLFLNDTSLNEKYDYSLIQSSIQPVAIVLIYSVFVLKLGPKFMKNKRAYDLKKYIVVYNVAQIILNSIVFLMVSRLIPKFTPFCSPVNNLNTTEDISVRKVHYYYMLLKFLDLFDTVFFVLRKKVSQVSFLHLHHHIGMALTTWVTLRYLPGGPLCYVFLWNTFVHVVMYGYYLLTIFDSTKNSVWWKKYLTQLQLAQHFTIFSIFIMQFFNSDCLYSKKWLAYYLVNTVLTIFLFLKFYNKQYKQNCDKKCY